MYLLCVIPCSLNPRTSLWGMSMPKEEVSQDKPPELLKISPNEYADAENKKVVFHIIHISALTLKFGQPVTTFSVD